MNTVEVGDRLEDDFYDYLVSQQQRGELVYGVYDPTLCQIHKKKKYYCKEREADIEFDLVVEVFRQNSAKPHLQLVFECKNYRTAVPESALVDFSDKLARIFKHSSKGVMVISSRLQSGARKLAENRGLGVIKFDPSGAEFVLDRSTASVTVKQLTCTQIFDDESQQKSLKFSAFWSGCYFGSVGELIFAMESSEGSKQPEGAKSAAQVPFVSESSLVDLAESTLRRNNYHSGPVDLRGICSALSIKLIESEQKKFTPNGKPILGSARFLHRTIEIYKHDNRRRERFTIAHEIGHFVLGHDKYIRSETVLEQDLQLTDEREFTLNYSRLEVQANKFAAYLLLPNGAFHSVVEVARSNLGIQDRGHGYIYVDDQHCNYTLYNELLSRVSTFFDVSKQAIERKLADEGLLADNRKKFGWW